MLINCGNGGDIEFEQDRIYWVVWITLNIKTTHFKVFSQSGIPADKAIVTFANPKHATIFALTAPTYVPAFSQQEMELVFKGRDELRLNR